VNEFVITLDVDWAPDPVIESVAALLRERGVRATWFITHRSRAVDRLAEVPELFELGIHPNFLPGSSHGDTEEEVLEHACSLVPQAVSLRTHGLVQSGPLTTRLIQQGRLAHDVSTFLPGMPYIRPVEHWAAGSRIIRIPYFWSDDFEWQKPEPSWLLAPLVGVPGLKVMGFHPIHVFLNSAAAETYDSVKRAFPRLHEASREALASFAHQGEGTRTIFRELLDYLSERGRSMRISDVYERWCRSSEGADD
jgi:hypothetical protein